MRMTSHSHEGEEEDDLNQVRQQLCDALGQASSAKYFLALKRWFKGKISKSEFDALARGLFCEDTVHIHNIFLLNILSKCQIRLDTLPSPASRRVRRSVKRPPPNLEKNFATNQMRLNSVVDMQAVRFPPPTNLAEGSQLCSQDGLLPDTGLLHGRVILSAWENGLSDVDPEIISILLSSLEKILKNILQTAMMLRRPFRIQQGKLVHGFGTTGSVATVSEIPNVRQRVVGETMELKQSSVSCLGKRPPRSKISLIDILHALQYRGEEILPVASLRNTTKEALVQSLYPDYITF